MDKKIDRIAGKVAGATVVYSAILIQKSDMAKLIEKTVHPNKYGEHVTLHYFGDKGGTDTRYAGEKVRVRLLNHYSDDKGEAWTVGCDNSHVNEIKDASQTLHVTVSCAEGTRPVYSNTLIKNSEPDDSDGFEVDGVIAYYMSNRRWIC